MNTNAIMPLEWKTWVFKSFVHQSSPEAVIKTLADNGFDNSQHISNAMEIGAKAINADKIRRLNNNWQEWIAANLINGVSKDNIFNELRKHEFEDYEIINEIELASNHPYVKACTEYAKKLKKRDWLLATCDHLARLDPSYCEKIDEIDTPPFAEFLKNYYSKHKPVVLKNGIKNWKALGKWTPEYFAKDFGDKEVQIQFNRETDPLFEMKSPQFRKTFKMKEFVRMIEEDGDSNNYYMTGNNSTRNAKVIKSAFNDLGDFGEGYRDLTEDPTDRTFFWMGPKGTFTPLHHDLTNNMLVQVCGAKKVTLIPAWQVPSLYNDVHVFSQVDFSNVDYDRFPMMKNVTSVEVIINEGDALFIPIGWWHCVESLDKSISISFVNFNAPNGYADAYGQG